MILFGKSTPKNPIIATNEIVNINDVSGIL
jgi:hypothetical protein